MSAIYGCDRCRDAGFLWDNVHGKGEIKCPDCERWQYDPKQQIDQRRDIKLSKKSRVIPYTNLNMDSLTENQKRLYSNFKARVPSASDTLLLSWVEATEYNPSKDADLVAYSKVLIEDLSASRGDSIVPDSIQADRILAQSKARVKGMGMKQIRALAGF